MRESRQGVHSPKRSAVLLCVASTMASAGCAGDAGDAPPPAAAATERADALQTAVERVIPIEAIYLRKAGETAAPTNVRLRAQRTIALMNRPFQRAGVQFYLRSYKEVSAPVLAKIQFDNETLVSWAPSAGDKVRDDITNIWGTSPWPSRLATDAHFPSNWLGLSVAAAGVADAEYMFISSGSNASNGPHRHRYIYLNYNDIEDGDGTSAHEMGHSLRLDHPWSVGGTDPRTGAPTVERNYWDLSYCPGSSTADPHRFFADQAAANVGCIVGTPKMIHGPNVSTPWCYYAPGTGLLECWLPGRPGTGYNETHYHDSPALRRGVTFRDSSGAPGVNFMSYFPSPGTNGFSPSQIEIMRNALRYDYRVELGDVVNGVSNNPLVGKPKLGTATASRPPLYQIDVDGDGARDLVWWTVDPFGLHAANSATFTVAFAPAFTTRQTRYFGRPGDIPVVADFDGDTRPDHGVYRPDEAESGSPSSQGKWYFCPSNTAGFGSCATGGYQTRLFGEARDIPLPGLSMGAVPHLAVYRAENTTVYWGPAANPFPFSSIALDAFNAAIPHELLLDDWDGDGRTDLGTVSAATGYTSIALSTNGWTSANVKKIFFDPSFGYAVPLPDPYTYLPEERSGAVPVQGLLRATSGWLTGTASALALWKPGTGETCIVTNVASVPPGSLTGATCASTQWLGPGSGFPLGGLRHPRSADGIAMTAWVAQPNGGITPTLQRTEVSTGGIAGPPNRALTGARTRGTATFVADMGTIPSGTRDGLPELLAEGAQGERI